MDLARIDLVFFTGDLAYRGKPLEYQVATTELLDPVLSAVGVGKERLFAIPGNHDLDMSQFDLLPAALQSVFPNEVVAKPWLEEERRFQRLFEPFEGYRRWQEGYGAAGFGVGGGARILEIDGLKVGIVGFNSALMCRRNRDVDGNVNDFGFLTVGEQQVYGRLSEVREADLRIALIHHPFEWLAEFDRLKVQSRMERGFNVILRGHEHSNRVQVIRSTDGDAAVIRAGACYNGRVPERPLYANAYNFVSYDTKTGQYRVFLRRWIDARDEWGADYDTIEGGVYSFALGPHDRTSRRKPSVEALLDAHLPGIAPNDRTSRRKPKPVVSQEWFQSKAELYASADLISSRFPSGIVTPLKVFLCHGNEDKRAIRQLYDRLRADGIDPWLDEQNLLPGQNWKQEITRAVKASHVVLVCLSAQTVRKESFIQKEIKLALDVAEEKPEETIFIIPVRFDECEVPERVSELHWLDYFAPDGYERLMQALRYRAEEIGIDLVTVDEAERVEELGHSSRNGNRLDAAVQYYQRALAMWRQLENKSGIIRCEQILRNLLEETGRPQDSRAQLVRSAQRFISAAGYEVQASNSPESFICQPKTSLWLRKLGPDVYATVETGIKLDTNRVIAIRDRARKILPNVTHVFAIVDQAVEDSGYDQIHSFRLYDSVNIMPIFDSLFTGSQEAAYGSVNNEASVLSYHLQKYLGKGFDPYNDIRIPVWLPDSFFGRAAFADDLKEQIAEGRPIGLFGLRKMGKSSLLLYLQKAMKRCPTAYINLQAYAPVKLPDIFAAILEAWRSETSQKIGLELNVPDAYRSITTATPAEAAAAFKTCTLDFLAQLQNTEGASARLVLELDEVELLLPSADANPQEMQEYLCITRTLRGILEEGHQLSLIAAGIDPAITRRSFWGQQQDQNPLYSLLQETYLPPLEERDCVHMISNLGRQIELTYTDEALDFVTVESGGHPLIARRLCGLAYIMRRRPKQLNLTDLQQASERFIYDEKYSGVLSDTGLWAEMTREARWGTENGKVNAQILLALADANTTLSVAELTTGDLSIAKITTALYELENLGVVKAERVAASPRYTLTCNLFRRWIQCIRLARVER